MNIIIPMGGKGERFKKDYVYPKPFINIYGHPIIFWIIDNLNLHSDDTIYISLYDDEYGLEYKLKKEYPALNFKIINLLYQTRGAVETIFNVLQNIDYNELNKKILCLDCDTIYFEDVLEKFRVCKDNVTFYFNANDKPEIFSYIIKDKDDLIIDINEKKFFNTVDNKYANTGGYGFKNGFILKQYCEYILNNNIKFKDEYYTSLLIKQMILDKHIFKGIEIIVDKFRCVGTPDQLKIFIKEVHKGYYKYKIKRFCFDLDNTLVTFPKEVNDYSTVEPKYNNIEILKTLKELGHYIIIYTARKMNTCKGDVKEVEKCIKDLTINTLKKFNIPYDELHFGKPYANYYIDDLGINALYNIENNIGVIKEKFTNIKTRNFNTIIELNNNIIKTSVSKDFDGQIFFYNNLPNELVNYFPKIYNTNNNIIQMEKIEGIEMSNLLVSKTFTNIQLLKLLETVKRLHDIKEINNPNIYLNYSLKLKKRYEDNKEIYLKLFSSEKVFEVIMKDLHEYEKNNLGIYSKIIHGDLVFSNIILINDAYKFIDPRGKLGNILTLEGDIYYDFAKILQSLYGYDNILLKKEIDKEYLQYLRNIFYEWLENNYENINIFHIKNICKSLIFSLIPLHENENHEKFFDILMFI